MQGRGSRAGPLEVGLYEVVMGMWVCYGLVVSMQVFNRGTVRRIVGVLGTAAGEV